MTRSNLPEIQITRNIRSKCLRMRVYGQQIKVTAPIFCTAQQIQDFIQQSESWLLKTWQLQQNKIPQLDRTLPQELKIFNLDQPIQIEYVSQLYNYQYDANLQLLSVSDRHPEQYLKTFVIEYAKQYLPLYLSTVAKTYGLSYRACHIRQPKTRWGSCSAEHDIMLNSGIILFAEPIVRYLCVHELAHTQYFNHSLNFWNEVAKYDPDFKMHRKILKTTALPYWWCS